MVIKANKLLKKIFRIHDANDSDIHASVLSMKLHLDD